MSDDTRAYYPKRWKLALMFAGSLVFVALGVWITLGDFSSSRKAWMAPFIGPAAIVFAGVCALVLGRRLLIRDPSLVVAPDGLWFGARREGTLHVDWHELDAMGPMSVKREKMLAFTVHDPDAVIARMSPVRRMMARTNLKFDFPILTVAQSTIGPPIAEVSAEILRIHREHGRAS